MKTLLHLSFIAFLLCLGLSVQAQSQLYMVSNQNSTLYSADTSSGSASTLGSMTATGGGSISQSNGLAAHPCTGELFAVVNHGSSFGRSIAIVDTNANATVLGSTGDLVASIAFDDNGVLYAVTGDGANTSETMYTVDLSDGSLTFFQTLGNGSDGEAIAYCPDNGLMYHWSGWSTLSGITFESINLNNNTVTNIGMTGSVSPTSIMSATYVGGGQFFVSYHSSNGFAFVDTSGAIVYAGYSSSVGIKGMAFQNQDPIAVSSNLEGLCPGTTATLTSTLATSYQWYLNGSAVSGATSQTYATSVAGQYNCLVTNGSCTDSSTVGVFLDSFDLPIVNVSSNDSGFCPGNVVTLTGSQGGQSQWFFNGDSISGATSNSYLANQEGWYNMVKTNQDGCSDSASTGVYLVEYEIPNVDLGDDDGICPGDSITLDAGFFPNATYFWDPFASGQINTVGDTGTYISNVQSQDGCIGSDTVLIGWFPEAIVDLGPDTLVCEGEVVTLDAGAGFSTYAWTGGSAAQTLDVTGLPEGDSTIYVMVQNSFGCEGMDSVVVSFQICSGINEIDGSLATVYPNPSNGLFTVSSKEALAVVTVYNLLGEKLNEYKVNDQNLTLQIEVPGTYLLSAEDVNGNVSTQRLIVQ
ncbi:MAG: T9SS type A sorting domain-containing protein [Flavobacteriales bacterium]|nr:T9SS type A sorting domain-containing protein [Flavobacteriales bacterium]